MVDIAKIYVRAIIGILGAVSATYLVGATVELEMMLGLYAAIGSYIYLDRSVSDEVQK